MIPSNIINVGQDNNEIKQDDTYIVIDVNIDIIVSVYNNKNQNIFIFKGQDARALYKRLITQGVITNMQHAAYVGYELARAEYALVNDVKYIQE